MEIKNRHIFILLLSNFLIRLALAIGTNLGVDEAYYFTYALLPDWSFFDHPPMLSWLILLTTANLHFCSEFFMRLGPLLIGTVNLYLVYRIAKLLLNHRAGIWAMLLASASIYNAVIAGTFILPDAPMAIFWLLGIWFATRFIKLEMNRDILLFGLSVGLAMLSKYHGVYLWFGLFAFILFYKRKHLKNPYLYLSLLLTIILFSPVIWWNINNHLASFSFHSGRTQSTIFHFKTLSMELLGQFAYNNPINVLIIISSLIAFTVNRKKEKSWETQLLLWLSLPLVFTVILLSCFNRTQPHWSSPAYYGLILFVAYRIEKFRSNTKLRYYRWIIVSNIAVVVLGTISIIHINYGLSPYHKANEIERQGKGDFTLDMYGYHQAGEKITAWIDSCQTVQGDKMDIITSNWFPGGHLEYYMAWPFHHNLYVYGTTLSTHHFMDLNEKQGNIGKGGNACFITFSTYYKPLPQLLADQFEEQGERDVIPIFRNEHVVYYAFLYPLYNAKTSFDMNQVPDN